MSCSCSCSCSTRTNFMTTWLCVDGMLWNICVGAHIAWQCRLLLLRYWPPGGTASSMSLWEKTLQCLRTSAWWAKYITHCSFILTRQVVRAEARVSRRILASSWRHHWRHHPRTYRDWKHYHRQTNTKAQKHSITTIVVDNDSVIKLQNKQIRKNPSWRISSLRQTVTCTWISLPACLPACPSLCSVSCPTIKCVSPHETSQCSLPAGFSVAVCWLFSFDSEASRHSTSLRGPSPWLH